MKFGYTIFYVEDVVATIEFYERAFGLKRLFLHESNQYGELETGPTKLAFASFKMGESNEIGFRKYQLNRSPTFEIALVSADIKGDFERAINAGARKVKYPVVKSWGQTIGYVSDLNGFLIEICTEI